MKTLTIKRNEAENRARIRAKRTPAQQLTLIQSRPGEHKRETARLRDLLKMA